METESCCPVCGDSTTPSDPTSNATNTGRFVKDQAFGKVFECFLRLFEVKDPPWFEKAFVFCSECSQQLTVVSELEQVMKEVERRLKESEKVVQDKFKSSESKFQSSGVYGRDQRYWKVRGEFLDKENNCETQGGVPTVAALLTSPETEMEFINCEVNPFLTEGYLDENEVPDDNSQLSFHPKNPVPRSKRHPKRNNPDESYKSKQSKRNEAPTIKVEPAEGEELYQILDEMESPSEDTFLAPYQVEKVESGTSQSSSFATDPLAFSQKLEGGVVEYIKVEIEEPSLLDQEDYENVQENYLEKEVEMDEEAKNAANRWMTPFQPEVTYFGTRLSKIGDGKQYQCSACDAIIEVTKRNHRIRLRDHVTQHHTDLYKCSECGERFANHKSLQKHGDLVHKSTPKPLETKTVLVSNGFGLGRTYTLKHCQVCRRPFEHVHELRSHIWTHYSEEERKEALANGEKPELDKKSFQCDKCPMKFVKEKALMGHLKFAHDPSKKREQLKVLDEETFSFYDVIINKIDGDEIMYKCANCGATRRTIWLARKHVIRKHTKTLQCNQCESRFAQEHMLKNHVKKVHTKDPSTATLCPICERPFYGKKSTPRYHIWTHFSDLDRQEALARGEKIPYGIEKSFQCEKCASSFIHMSELKNHQKKHDGVPEEKKICGVCGAAVVSLASHMRASHPKEEDFRFICSICDKKFAQYTNLKKHKLVTHRIGDMLKCDLCGKEYANKKNLEAHRNMHLNIRPYKCDVCPMAFTTAKVLKKHKLYKHEGVKCPPTRKRKTQKVVEENSDSDSD